MMKKVVLLGAIGLLSACATMGTPNTLLDGRWVQEDVRLPFILTIQEGRFSAKADCNYLLGMAKVIDGKLVTGTLVSTRIVCGLDAVKRDTDFSNFIAQQPVVTIQQDSMVLQAANKTLIFRRQSL